MYGINVLAVSYTFVLERSHKGYLSHSPIGFVVLRAAALAHLDVESAQHGVDAEQVLDRVVDVAVKGRVGDRRPQEVEGLLQEP